MKKQNFVMDLKGIKDKKNTVKAKNLFSKNKHLSGFQRRMSIKKNAKKEVQD